MGAKSSQRQYIATVSGVAGNFAQKSGGDISADATKIYDGGNIVPDVVAGPAEVGNITVSRAYEYSRDGALLKKLRKKVGNWVTTVTVTPTDANLVTLGNPAIYTNALLVGLTEPDVDASSADGASYSLEFMVGGVK